MLCPCGSNVAFESCCEPFIKGKALPDTAEKLMRSRYAAYTLVDVDYLKKTLAPESRNDFDAAQTKKWAGQAEWKGLQIQRTENGGPEDKKGVVEFTATYATEGTTLEHHEVSEFRKDEKGQWFFVDGDSHTHKEGESHGHHSHAKQQTIVREAPKVGRNDACPCGSGKKYKKCCAV